MPDDTTLENAGLVGRQLADTISTKVVETIDGFPGSTHRQRAAIATLVADSLYDYIGEEERNSEEDN